jgi:hypothetical protein
MLPEWILEWRKIAEYQFEQRRSERAAAVCLIRATQDKSPETPIHHGKRLK